MNTVMI